MTDDFAGLDIAGLDNKGLDIDGLDNDGRIWAIDCNLLKIRYDTRCYFNVRSKADISQLNLPHGTDN